MIYVLMKQSRLAIINQEVIAKVASRFAFRKKSILPSNPINSTVESDLLHDLNRDNELLRYIQENDNAFDDFGIK